MAKAKVDATAEPKSNPGIILEIVRKIGKDGVSEQAVRDMLKREYKDIDLSESTIKQYTYTARKTLGWVKTRGGIAGGSRGSGDPTLADLMNALKVEEDVGMSPAKLFDLVEKLNKFGDLHTLTTCLDALVELSD